MFLLASCQCLREHNPWMSYRFTALPNGEQERRPRIARRQEPGSFVHPQPYTLHVLQLRICPRDERGGVPKPTGAHHLHGGYHLANKVLVAFGYAHQFLGGSNDMLFLRSDQEMKLGPFSSPSPPGWHESRDTGSSRPLGGG